MATTTTAIFPVPQAMPAPRRRRGNPRGLGLSVLATVGLYTALPIAVGVVARVAAPLGFGAVELLAVAGLLAGAGAAGWFLRSWWLPVLAPLPGVGLALLTYSPADLFLMILVVVLVGMALLTTSGALVGVVAGKLARRPA